MTTKNLEKLAEIGEKKLLENLNPRIETKIMNSKYTLQEEIYTKINSQLKIKYRI